jgi:hypothetical protein
MAAGIDAAWMQYLEMDDDDEEVFQKWMNDQAEDEE